MTVPVLTLERALEMPTCADWPAEKVRGVYGDRQELTIEDLQGSPVASTDLLWVFLREPWLDDLRLSWLAQEFVSMVLPMAPELYALDLAREAAEGRVTQEHIRHPGADTEKFWETSTPAMLSAHYAALWSVVAVARAKGSESGERVRERQVDLVVRRIKEIHHG
jgi:hypothetical protein